MSLNTQGIISAVIIAIYVPILVLALRIISRYGVRERGWLLLVIFSLSESQRQDLVQFTYHAQSESLAAHC